jgi:pyridinium-3,5-bisthiocarboxylic acid mononucleotide nickel chelatase
MGKIIYFDCFSGISGDMVLGALVDLGVDFDLLKQELLKLNIKGYEINAKAKNQMGIVGTDVIVDCFESEEDQERNLREITKIIVDSSLNEKVKKKAIDIFTVIAISEAKVHGKNVEEIHFHEVGAVDSIVDIVGAAICLDQLGADKYMCSSLTEGTGFVNCRHGRLPVPVPAVMEMLKEAEISIKTTDYDGELITPTGIGILKGIGAKTANINNARLIASGYGFGKRDTGGLNALRVILFEESNLIESSDSEKAEYKGISNKSHIVDESKIEKDEIAEIETNIDDMTGEMLGYVMEKLISEKALDVFFTPIQMKKNRPAIKLTVLCKPNELEKFSKLIIHETTSLGVRYCYKNRLISKRQSEEVKIGDETLILKKSSFDGIEKKSFEYEDLAKGAKKTGKPIFEIEKLFNKSLKG